MNRLFSFFISIFFFSATAAFSQSLSKEAEARLLSFCELYSTVMYYYPEPNLQDFPWDAFAYQGYKMATTSESDEEFIQKTDSLFRIIAPGVQISRKEFDLSRITPKDTSLYPERVFWQHRGGLNVNGATFSNASTLNYIYKKPIDNYQLIQIMAANSQGLLGRKLRFSLMAKIEDNNDTLTVFTFNTANLGEGAKKTGVNIRAFGNEWKRYEAEIEHPENIIFSRLTIYHHKKGTVYLDDLKIERFENGNWEEVEIENADFERYSPLGNLVGWKNMYPFGALAVADSSHAVEGTYCLKLPVVQNNILYTPISMDQPYTVSLPDGYKAYIPLQLYANEKRTFPYKRNATNNLITVLQKDTLTGQQHAIACVMQAWAALYHDYPYRETGFEDKINRLLLQTIRALGTSKTTDFYTIIKHNFLQWINDPHLFLRSEFMADDTIGKKIINLPIKFPDATCLTENQFVVVNVLDTITNLQAGDVILQVNDINIDSLLQLYKTYNISRRIQHNELIRLMQTHEVSEMKVRLLRNNEIVDVSFFTDTRQKHFSAFPEEEKEKNRVLHDSLKETKDLFYLNSIYPSDAFKQSIIQRSEDKINQSLAADSLITELNKYKALILDVRGRVMSNILQFFNECMGIDLNRDSDVTKIAFYPVAKFEWDSTNFLIERKREDLIIRVPVYVLIDYNTMSAPERALVNLKASGRATFIGSNTAGAAGPVCKTKIADGATLTYTTGRIIGLDDNPMSYQGVGIPPDIYVYPTAQGIAEGRDEVLEKAIEAALDNL